MNDENLNPGRNCGAATKHAVSVLISMKRLTRAQAIILHPPECLEKKKSSSSDGNVCFLLYGRKWLYETTQTFRSNQNWIEQL